MMKVWIARPDRYASIKEYTEIEDSSKSLEN